MTNEKITITIDKENHKRLALLKINRNFKTFDDVLEFLLKKVK